jgi:1-hydroxycarotenoid 3,4-desaturase
MHVNAVLEHTDRSAPVVVIGAGIAGLASAVRLAAKGIPVRVLERAALPGGKMREVAVGNARIDAGPTVMTMRWVFEDLFSDAGTTLSDHVSLTPADILARHAWADGSRLDLFADLGRTVQAISTFASPAEGERYAAFCERSAAVYSTLEDSFIKGSRPSPVELVRRAGVSGLMGIEPFSTLWSSLGKQFKDPRLRQLFARYSTYCGSSPFKAPATLMLVAHVEREGVWLVDGGMHRIARAMAELAQSLGVEITYNAEISEIQTEGGHVSGVKLVSGEPIVAAAVVSNSDVSALASGLFGERVSHAAPRTPADDRSLSAVTWSMVGRPDGFPLLRHTVFFCDQYEDEFSDIFSARRLPRAPTVYICAQDRGAADDAAAPDGPERLFCLANAPAIGDAHRFGDDELHAYETAAFGLLDRCGLSIERMEQDTVRTTPSDFEALFPASGGALYGPASHGWRASFNRAGSRTRVPGLYLAGGSVHPGPGIPMAALSGKQAADAILSDRIMERGIWTGHRTSRNPFRRVATRGGIWTR